MNDQISGIDEMAAVTGSKYISANGTSKQPSEYILRSYNYCFCSSDSLKII